MQQELERLALPASRAQAWWDRPPLSSRRLATNPGRRPAQLRRRTRSKIRAEGSAEITKDRAARIADLLLATAPQTPSVSGNVHVGAPLPGDVDLMPLPKPIVDLVPEYRDYEYVVVNNTIVFVQVAAIEA